MILRSGRFAFHTGIGIAMLTCFVLAVLFTATRPGAAAPNKSVAALSEDGSLLDGYRHVEVASVSDAMEKVTGKKV